MNIAEINPYIRVAMHSVLSAHWVLGRRIIFDYELIYIEEGHFTLTYGQEDFSCKKGDFILLRPSVPHVFRIHEADLSQPHIHFDLVYDHNSPSIPISYKDKPDMTRDELKMIREDIFAGYPLQPFVRFSDKKRALRLFYSVIKKGSAASDPLSQKGDMMKLLSMLIRDNFPQSFALPAPNGIEKQIKDFLDADQGFNMSLDDFEKQFAYDKFYLEKCFKRAYGVSIMAYRNKVRMKAAKRMLKDNSVASVSEALGYNSIYSFSRAFKHFYGFSPVTCREDKKT